MAAIIFDFDGTIADSFDYVSDFLTSAKGLPPLDAERKNDLRHLSMIAMARKLGFHWWQGPFLFLKGRRRMNQAIKDLGTFKEMPELIRKLHAEGHELFILSNNSRKNIRRFLAQQNLAEHFLQVYGGVGIFNKGPALRRLLKKENIEKENSVYIGDELKDVESAKLIGMRIIAVTWGFAARKNLAAAKPDKLVDTPAELMAVLEEI